MSKVNAETDEWEDPRADEVEDAHHIESQPLQRRSHDDGMLVRVRHFTLRYGLEGDLDLFEKAAPLARNDTQAGDVPSITPDELDALRWYATYRWRQPWTLYFTIFVCSVGAIEQGWAQTGMNGANIYLPKAMGINSSGTHDSLILGLLNCGLYLANACWGSWLSEPVNHRLGRRGAIAVANVFCLVGNLGSGLSSSWPMLLFFRLVLGTGLGLNASTVSILAAESAPANIRGGLGTSWQMFTAGGILLGFLANVAFYDLGEGIIWRYQLAAPLIPTLPLLLLVYICPESASWHFKGERYKAGFKSLVRLRISRLQAAMETYAAYVARNKDGNVGTAPRQSFTRKLRSLVTISRNRHAVYASYTAMLSQQLCGINIIAFYSSTIFSASSFTPITALWASVIFGLVNFLGAFPAIWTMDSFGRRRLLLWTLPFMAATMALAGLSFTLPNGTLRFVTLAGLIYLFCALYSPGMGPVPVAYSAEVYPQDVREIGMSLAISTASTWATVLSLTFPVLLGWAGEVATFELYALLNVVAWILCWTFVREVKGKGLEDMDEVFETSAATFVRECWDDRPVCGRRRRKLGDGWVEVGQDDINEDDAR